MAGGVHALAAGISCDHDTDLHLFASAPPQPSPQGDWDRLLRDYTELIYAAIHATLKRYGHGGVCHCCHPEGIFQEVVVALKENDSRRLRQFEGRNGCTLASYLKVVVTRLVIDLLRKKPPPTVSLDELTRRGTPWEQDVPVPSPQRPDEALIDAQRRRFVEQALARLPGRDRLILQLIYTDGLKVGEAAKVVGLTTGAIYTRVSRIKNRLRQAAESEGYL